MENYDICWNTMGKLPILDIDSGYMVDIYLICVNITVKISKKRGSFV